MMGRLDIEYKDCDYCNGTGKDPKNRKRGCPHGKNGKREFCSSCGEPMPCSGTEPVFDQTYCSKESVAPKQGETWEIGAYTNLVFAGTGRDFSLDKYLIFVNIEEGNYFLITTEEFYSEKTPRKRVV